MADTPNSSITHPHHLLHDSLPGIDRDDDPTTAYLRGGDGTVDLDDIASNLNTHNQNSYSVASSSRAPTESVFSSRKESTKPTSYGTSYPVFKRYGKGKAIVEDTRSLSATCGSGSDTERNNDFTGLGGQFSVEPAPLMRKANKRQKKPKLDVVLHQDRLVNNDVSDDESQPLINSVPHRNGKASKYLRRRNKIHHDDLAFAEEGRVSSTFSQPSRTTLSNTRFYVMIALIITIILTFALSTWAAFFTGKTRMHCTKGIIFASTVFISFLTVVTMLTARRALHEALLTGLLECATGFTLLHQISEFM